MALLTQSEAGPITKDTTLNAAVKRYPELLYLLNTFRLDQPWCGSETLEWVAWHRGMPVDGVVDELNRAITRVIIAARSG